MGKPKRSCVQQKQVRCKGVCPWLTDPKAAVIYQIGPTCVLDVLDKISCDRAANGACSLTQAGGYICSRLDRSPFACGKGTTKYDRETANCVCSKRCRQHDTSACQIVAMSF